MRANEQSPGTERSAFARSLTGTGAESSLVGRGLLLRPGLLLRLGLALGLQSGRVRRRVDFLQLLDADLRVDFRGRQLRVPVSVAPADQASLAK